MTLLFAFALATATSTAAFAEDMAEEIARYCGNVASTVQDQRYVWQTKMLARLQEQLEQRIATLEEKRREYQAWLEERDKVLGEVEDHVVAIYARMRPDAAAAQIAGLEETKAIAVLYRLKPREASAILNEMEPGRAAQLTSALADKMPRRGQENQT